MIINSIATVTLPQLRRAIALRERIEALEHELASILGDATAPIAAKTRRGKRVMSQEARNRIARAQRARWAKQKAKPTDSAAPASPVRKRKMSKAARAKIAAGARNRWAKIRAAKQGA
jgi:hypothetical protein